MLAVILLARGMDISSFAAFGYFHLTISMLAAYASMGLGVAASRFFAEARHQVTAHQARLLGTLCVLSIGLAIIACATVLLLPEAWIGAGLGVPRWLLAIGVLVLVLQVVPSSAIVGLEQYRQASVLAGLTGTSVLIAAFWAVRIQDVRVAMWGIIASALLLLVGEAMVVVRTLRWWRIAESLTPQKAQLRRVLDLSGPMFLVSLMSASAAWVVGRVILSGPGGEHAFALFTIGLQWFALGLVFPGMFSRVLLPLLVRAAADLSGREVPRRLVRSATILATGTAAIMAIAGMVLGPWILSLYGNEYQVSRWFISAYLVAAVLSAPTNTLGSALVTRDSQWGWLGLTSIWLFILIGSAFAFRAEVVWGAPATYASAYAALTVGALLMARRKSLV